MKLQLPFVRSAMAVVLLATACVVVAARVEPQQPPLPADSFPEWTHHYIWRGHVMVVDPGDQLTAMMNSVAVIEGKLNTRVITRTFSRGDVLVNGAIENTGEKRAVLLTSDGERLELEAGMRVVVTDEALYGFDPGSMSTPQPNICVCRCGGGWTPMAMPTEPGSKPAAEPCLQYDGLGPCIDPSDSSQLETLTASRPGFGPSW